ncbi:hypothetical protein GCM10010274_12050 [Streptomyces lavendofoliae]|uniref:Uncharacterized protein n=1 Tax=Streptomyces lavendofoliae TaxID=67314 RepID=A0A918HTU3_9ACTN|nr:hypothetical protein GCM10010274_12050 [Streptomyces lavendofoliae]
MDSLTLKDEHPPPRVPAPGPAARLNSPPRSAQPVPESTQGVAPARSHALRDVLFP